YGSTQGVPLSVPGVSFNEAIDCEYDPLSDRHGPRFGVSRLTCYRGGCRWGSWADASRLTSWADIVLSLACWCLGKLFRAESSLQLVKVGDPPRAFRDLEPPFKLAKIENLSEVGQG
ncbi:hypothetical protein BHE74_00027555, partial [Ensete ventricosum]